MSTTTTKTRTITLTGRAPVRIVEDDWPLIASAKDDSYVGNDYSRYQQALAQGECDQYAIRVREHADGRILVYGALDAATAWTGSESRRGGVLLTPPGEGPLTADDGRVVPDSEIVAAIQVVGADCNLPEHVIRACIADLPPEAI